MISKLFFVLVLTTGCVTIPTIQPGQTMANGVTYVKSPDAIANCKDLGIVMGRPSGVYGGAIGQSEARIDAMEQASRARATHFLETSKSWTTGSVSGVAYRCLE